MASTLGPRFYFKCHAPRAWNASGFEPSGTELFVQDSQGFGWKTEVYSAELRNLLLSDESTYVGVYVAHVTREDGEIFYLFQTLLERNLFEALQAIKGINVNVAATATSIAGPGLLLSWLNGASTKGHKIPGLGPKSLEKLVYEMQSKKKKFLALLSGAGVEATSQGASSQGATQIPSSILMGLEKLGLRSVDTLRIYDSLCTESKDFAKSTEQEILSKILQRWGREKVQKV